MRLSIWSAVKAKSARGFVRDKCLGSRQPRLMQERIQAAGIKGQILNMQAQAADAYIFPNGQDEGFVHQNGLYLKILSAPGGRVLFGGGLTKQTGQLFVLVIGEAIGRTVKEDGAKDGRV